MTLIEPRNVAEAELRFGDWGPGYLATSAEAAFGTVVLRPGDEFGNHLHEHHTESFIVVEGEADVWFDRTEPIRLRVGDLVSAPAGVQHYLRNSNSADFRAVFVKTPWVDGDKIDHPWQPPAANAECTAATDAEVESWRS